jgi:ribosome-associated toxin RatA of RatAB toxin-antitoxin module
VIRAVAGLAYALFAMIAAQAHGQVVAHDLMFTARRDGEFIVVEARVDLRASPETVWAALTDYEKYPAFISTMRESKILSRGPEGVVVNQKGNFGFLFFSQEIETRLVVQESPPGLIVARSVQGSFRDMRGRYELQPQSGGTRLLYSGRFHPEFSLPPIVGTSVVHYAMQRNFTEMLDEIMRRDALARRPQKAGE